MIFKKNIILNTSGLKPILFDVCYLPTHTRKPVVIFCHGYKGFKDWGAWNLVAISFADAGFFFLKFNFSHNGGTIEQPIDFPDLEAFAQNNFSKELFDLDRMIDFVSSKNDFENEINIETIALIGHSRGGGVALLKANENPKVKKVITWAGVSDFKVRFNEGTEGFKLWKKIGITFVENGRTKQQMPHKFQFYEDFIENEERLTISTAVKKLKIPLLIIHGAADQNVSVEEARAISRWNQTSKLMTINNANHVFGACHPWVEKRLPQDLQKVIDYSITFLIT